MTPFEKILCESIATLETLRRLEEPIQATVELVTRCLSRGNKLLICGNGGSAADASHLTTELVVRFLADRRPYPAICLNDSGSTLTAAANDYGFDHVFARQVEALGQRGDVLMVFTTSGKSPNIVRVLQQARAMGLDNVAFLGRDGGEAKNLASIELIVPSQHTARIQEAHHLLIHALCEMVERGLTGSLDTTQLPRPSSSVSC